MNTFQSTLSSHRIQRILFWFGVAVLAAGIIVLIVKLAGGSDKTSVGPDKGFQPVLPAKSEPLKTAAGVKVTKYSQLGDDVKVPIRKFILGAVAGQDYAGSFKYTTPTVRQGYSYKQWVHSGERPYVPYPVYRFDTAQYHLVSATPKEILIEVGLSPTPQSGQRPTVFQIGLRSFGKGAKSRWLVDYWMTRYTPPFPIN